MMKRTASVLLLGLLWTATLSAATFQEFYCDAANGSNVNAGDKLTAAVTTTNGAYTQGGGAGGGTNDRFVAASGTPFAGVVAGDYVALRTDGGTVATSLHRILVVNSNTSIDVDAGTNFAGTRPTTAANGRTATIGGQWKGPNGASAFPFTLANIGNARDGSANRPSINLKNNATYAITATNNNAAANCVVAGYATTVRDGGKATIDGSGASSTIQLFAGGTASRVQDIIFSNNGPPGAPTANTQMLLPNAAGVMVVRCVFHDAGGPGIATGSSTALVMEQCEFYSCGLVQGDAAFEDTGGASGNSVSWVTRCSFHDTPGAYADPMSNGNFFGMDRCVCIRAAGNGTVDVPGTLSPAYGGVIGTQAQAVHFGSAFFNCDFYASWYSFDDGEGGVGIQYAPVFEALGGYRVLVENCNFCLNGQAVDGAGSDIASALKLHNCAFGTGTDASFFGDFTNNSTMESSGLVTLAAPTNPWVNPTGGDFRPKPSASSNAGIGSFIQTGNSWTGRLIAFPSIGAIEPYRPGRVF